MDINWTTKKEGLQWPSVRTYVTETTDSAGVKTILTWQSNLTSPIKCDIIKPIGYYGQHFVY